MSRHRTLICLVMYVICVFSSIALSSQFAGIETDITDWNGFQQHHFKYLERDCFVTEPDTPLAQANIPLLHVIGLFVAAGPDAGIIEYSIDGAPVQTLDTLTKWSAGLNLPWAYILDADLTPGNHTLYLEMSKENNSRSKGHALRIRYFLVKKTSNRPGPGGKGQ